MGLAIPLIGCALMDLKPMTSDFVDERIINYSISAQRTNENYKLSGLKSLTSIQNYSFKPIETFVWLVYYTLSLENKRMAIQGVEALKF